MQKNWLSNLVLVGGSAFLVSSCNFAQESATLYRGPTPTFKRMRELKEMGVKSIISVRHQPRPEKAAYAQKLGMNFYHVPTSVFKAPTKNDIQKYIALAKDPKNQPIYVCCVGGRDRTSFYLAAHRIALEGWTTDEALYEFKKNGPRRWWPWFSGWDEILSNKQNFEEVAEASKKVADKQLP